MIFYITAMSSSIHFFSYYFQEETQTSPFFECVPSQWRNFGPFHKISKMGPKFHISSYMVWKLALYGPFFPGHPAAAGPAAHSYATVPSISSHHSFWCHTLHKCHTGQKLCVPAEHLRFSRSSPVDHILAHVLMLCYLTNYIMCNCFSMDKYRNNCIFAAVCLHQCNCISMITILHQVACISCLYYLATYVSLPKVTILWPLAVGCMLSLNMFFSLLFCYDPTCAISIHALVIIILVVWYYCFSTVYYLLCNSMTIILQLHFMNVLLL